VTEIVTLNGSTTAKSLISLERAYWHALCIALKARKAAVGQEEIATDREKLLATQKQIA
jgi:hypothetical protein